MTIASQKKIEECQSWSAQLSKRSERTKASDNPPKHDSDFDSTRMPGSMEEGKYEDSKEEDYDLETVWSNDQAEVSFANV